MSKLPLITIGVPIRNSAYILHEFLDSLESIDYPKKRIEIIFVENYSEDETLSILKKWSSKNKKKYRRFHLLRSKLPSISKLRNIIAKKAEGDYLFFLDSDVIPDKKVIKVLLGKFEKNKKLGIAGIFYRVPGKKSIIQFRDDLWFFASKKIPAIGMGCTIIKNKVFQTIGLFDENLTGLEDIELCYRASEKFDIYLDTSMIFPHHSRLKRGFSRYSFFDRLSDPRKAYILLKNKPKYILSRLIFYSLFWVSFISFILNNRFYPLFLLFLFSHGVYCFLNYKGIWKLFAMIVKPLDELLYVLGILLSLFRYIVMRDRRL